MPVVTYETLDGEILGETRGGVERDYIPDPLGSVAALIDSSQAKTDSFTYWPYGEERSRTGTTPTPFRFVGSLGYYRDDSGRTYVRARHLRTVYARWQTKDPLWPEEGAYGYVGDHVLTYVDYTGMTYSDCYWGKIMAGKSPFAACVQCSGLPYSQALAKCSPLPKRPISQPVKDLLIKLRDICVPGNPASSAYDCCVGIALDPGGLVAPISGGSNIPSSAFCGCEKRCEDAMKNAHEPIDMGDVLAGFNACVGGTPTKPDPLTILKLLLQGARVE